MWQNGQVTRVSLPPFSGSEREFDRVPNWRRFRDFWFPIEADGLDDCHLWATNRPTVVGAEGLPSRSCASRGMDGLRDRPETLHSMKVEKLSYTGAFPGSVRIPGCRGICGGSRDTVLPEGSPQFEALVRAPSVPVPAAPQGSLESYEGPVSIGCGEI